MNKTLISLAALLLGAAPALAHNGVIHEAPHGGILKATKTAHFEILLAPKGGVRIYFMDASGRALPATAASELSVEIDRPGQKTEYVTMKPDTTSTLWTGPSKPVTDPKSVVRVGTVVRGESELIEIPRSQFPVYDKPAAKGKTHAH
ncbi:hypothetical protein [Sphingomonas sp.]|uniref:hypothetical protein n=1 Tax=Sphingomonas sp. TaxID=28214 RepID=UPI000DB8239B|nr:hypothetical protein [Sphingomonas sp.]PZU07458.1 MAG: hypothetical protein DI605_15455 [Sphingomonas sp.]